MMLQPAASPPLSILPALVKSILWVLPTIISIFLLLRFSSLDSQFHQMQHSLDNCPSDAGPSWILDPLPETTTSSFNSLPSDQPKWWFGDDPSMEGQTYTPEATPITTVEAWPSSSNTWDSSPATSAIPTITPTASHDAQLTSLMPITNFVWPIAFEMPAELHQTFQVVLNSLGAFWQVVRKVYHYPLDPSE